MEYASFTPDANRVVSCGDPNYPTLRLWDAVSGNQLPQTADTKGGFFCVAVLPDGRECASAGGDGFVRLWRWEK